MTTDNPAPLCSVADLQTGAFADLVQSFSDEALTDICVEASRNCESETGRRFMPFTITESQRAEGIDPDELGIGSGIPLDLLASLGASYAAALGSGANLVRKLWLREYAPQYPEMWTYSGVTVNVTVSIGGTNATAPMAGPMADSGLVWLHMGTYVPIGSLMSVTYSGGYTVATPANLRRAAKYFAAAICCRELDPRADTGHDPAALEKAACGYLTRYGRE